MFGSFLFVFEIDLVDVDFGGGLKERRRDDVGSQRDFEEDLSYGSWRI